jgi:hypothetical protein
MQRKRLSTGSSVVQQVLWIVLAAQKVGGCFTRSHSVRIDLTVKRRKV